MLAVPPRRRGDSGKGADLDDPFLEHERPSRRAEHAFGGFLGAAIALCGPSARATANSSPLSRAITGIRAKLVGQCAGNAFEQAVAGLIAMLVVDGLEPVDLERDDDEAVARAPRPRPHISAARSAKPLRL